MKIRTTLTFASVLCLASACGDDSDPTGGTDPGETESESETETETDPPPPADCSCWVDELAPPEDLFCLAPSEVVPGCDVPPSPCAAIDVFEDVVDEEPPEIMNPEVLECVVQHLADGEQIAFDIETTHNFGGASEEFWPTDEGYVRVLCGVFDNPPYTSEAERLQIASPEFFVECLDPEGELASDAVYACLLDAFTAHAETLPVCE